MKMFKYTEKLKELYGKYLYVHHQVSAINILLYFHDLYPSIHQYFDLIFPIHFKMYCRYQYTPLKILQYFIFVHLFSLWR